MADYAQSRWRKITTIDSLLADEREKVERKALGFQRALAQYALKDVGTRFLKEAGYTAGGRRRGTRKDAEISQFSGTVQELINKK